MSGEDQVMRYGHAIALACLAALVVMPQPSMAGHDGRKHAPRAKRQSVAPSRTCQPLCVADVTPCDPMQYKIADGRCSDLFFRF